MVQLERHCGDKLGKNVHGKNVHTAAATQLGNALSLPVEGV